MSFIRKIKKGQNVYLALVESKWVKGKVIQRVIKYIGKEINGKVIRRVNTEDIQVEAVKHYADVLVIHKLATVLNLEKLLDENGKYIFLKKSLFSRR